MTVWIVCDTEVFSKKKSAMALVKRLLLDGVVNHFRRQQPDRYRAIHALLKEDVELALAYWNEHHPDGEHGTGASIRLHEAVVRED